MLNYEAKSKILCSNNKIIYVWKIKVKTMLFAEIKHVHIILKKIFIIHVKNNANLMPKFWS